MTTFARLEREALSDLFLELGPDQPTLCEGWQTRDLAAHLVVRDSPANAGIMIRPLASVTESVQRRLARKDWASLVEQVRHPPFWAPLSWGPIDKYANTGEFFVHHEDVRRAQSDWEPRLLDPAHERALWSLLKAQGRGLFRNAPVGVELVTPDGRTAVVRPGEPMVRLHGAVQELVMYAFGRRGAALVDVEGDPATVAEFTGTSLGF